MIKIFPLSIAILCSVVLFSCSEKEKAQIASKAPSISEFPRDYITVGTFNLQWLGDGENDRLKRTQYHYKQIAEIIRNSEADILGLQEIENEKALEKLLNYLPEYKYIIGKNGGAQRLAIIYKENIYIQPLGEYYPVMIEKGRTKPGLWLYAKAGNFDFYLMNVHFKSSSHWDKTAQKRAESLYLRKSQAIVVTDWVDSLLKYTNEKDILVVGDFNDSPKRKKNRTLDDLQEILWFITADIKSCKYPSAYVIDHVAVSDIAADRYIEDSEYIENTTSIFTKEELALISDHCLITVKFNVTLPDNDPVSPLAKK